MLSYSAKFASSFYGPFRLVLIKNPLFTQEHVIELVWLHVALAYSYEYCTKSCCEHSLQHSIAGQNNIC